jgi:hypothetical protein
LIPYGLKQAQALWNKKFIIIIPYGLKQAQALWNNNNNKIFIP